MTNPKALTIAVIEALQAGQPEKASEALDAWGRPGAGPAGLRRGIEAFTQGNLRRAGCELDMVCLMLGMSVAGSLFLSP